VSVGQSDFASGTYLITDTGGGGKKYYDLTEDITFNPNPSRPALDDTTYLQRDGWFLGFHSAVVIEAEFVVFDCNDFTIKMHEDFHKRQRFFGIITLGNRPFIPGAGPPPLASPNMNGGSAFEAELRPGKSVTIRDCNFGLTSHHSILGNNNEDVVVKDSTFVDFEVGAIALNNCQGVRIRRNTIGPSLAETFPAFLSQAIFLDHMATTIGLADDLLGPIFQSTQVTLRGSSDTAKSFVDKLNTDLEDFLAGSAGADNSINTLCGTKGVPDGSAMYGILLHKVGPAAGEFGAHPFDNFTADVASENATFLEASLIWDNTITGLELNPEAWISFHKDGRQVQGPAAAVFRATHWKDASGAYVGNSLSDAQIAVYKVLEAAQAGGDDAAAQRAEEYYNASFIPQEIQDWAAGTVSTLNTDAFDKKCDGDAMSHKNKGIVGIRLGYQLNPQMGPIPPPGREHRRRGIVISNLVNRGVGPEDASLCVPPDNYKGNDVRATRLTNCIDSRGILITGMTAGVGGKTIQSEDHQTLYRGVELGEEDEV